MSTPVVFLAFANDLDDHLTTLKDESRAVFDTLQPLDNQHLINVHREESTSVDDLYKDLLTFNDRVVIFHYAGHANGSMLQLDEGDGNASGLAQLLGRQRSLKLVFLNGCATKDQVRLLHNAGVPAVIATAVKINDTKATMFSKAFYQALVKGESIEASFDHAKGFLESKFDRNTLGVSINRHPNYDFGSDEEGTDEDVLDVEFEWSLYIRQDMLNEIQQWRLATAKQAWQVNLQDSSGSIKNLDDEPISLFYQIKQRTLPSVRCHECNSVVVPPSEYSPQHCSICGATSLSNNTSHTLVCEKELSFDISSEDAKHQAANALSLTDTHDLIAMKLYLPSWVFTLKGTVEVSGERAEIVASDSDLPTLSWTTVTESLEIDVSEFIVPAYHSVLPLVKKPVQSSWSVDHHLVNDRPSDVSMLVMDVTLEEAFTQLVDRLDYVQQQQVQVALGGIEQRNIHTKRRYSNVSFSSVLLPCWMVLKPSIADRQPVMINAHTGHASLPVATNQPAVNFKASMNMINSRHTASSESQQSSYLASAFSGIGIGIMVGLLLGLAAPQDPGTKSVVAIFIGAIGVALAAILGLNDRHFSTAKGIRIGSFGIAVSLCAVIGIYMRANNVLSPSIEEQMARIEALFPTLDDAARAKLLAQSATVNTEYSDEPDTPAAGSAAASADNLSIDPQDATRVALQQALRLAQTAVFNDTTTPAPVCSDLNAMNETHSPTEVLQAFKFRSSMNSLGWESGIAKVEQNYSQTEQKQMLFMLRDAYCGGLTNNVLVTPESSICQLLRGVETDDGQSIKAILDSREEIRPLSDKIQSSISRANQAQAYVDLSFTLCAI